MNKVAHVRLTLRMLLVGAVLSAQASGPPANAAAECEKPAVAFRLDDVQDYWLSDAQKAVIELFSEHRLPLTLAVIGGFFGQDKRLVATVRSHLGEVEIANHGLHAKDNSDGRSILLSLNRAALEKQIRESSSKIEGLLGVSPKVFIPHRNQFDDDVLATLDSLKFEYISSACSWHIEKPFTCEDPCGSLNERTCSEPDPYGLVHIPVGASTQWEPAPGKGSADPAAVLDQIRRSTAKYGFAVVMLHPQDFVWSNKRTNPRALAALENLLSKIREAGTHRVVTLSKVSLPCEPHRLSRP